MTITIIFETCPQVWSGLYKHVLRYGVGCIPPIENERPNGNEPRNSHGLPYIHLLKYLHLTLLTVCTNLFQQ